MPTYEYACKSCGEHLEVVQSFRDEPLTECANCGGELRKVFGAIGIAFKGSGFYRTDSRSSGGSKEPKSEPAPAPAAKEKAKEKKESSSGTGDAKAAASS
jgi:putative FmdB family regulatory protein